MKKKSIKNSLLEKEILELKTKLKENEKIIAHKNNIVTKYEEEQSMLINENYKLKDKYRRVREERMLIGNNMLFQMLNNNTEVVLEDQRLENQINEICPNPDEMTYEQLIQLQENIGFVSKGLSETQINEIPSVKFTKNNKLKNNFSSNCTVCQEDFDESEMINKLRCGHEFHKSCVKEWLSGNNVCPNCKLEVIK